eukprot:5221188-Pyramimonas_sp.AAC.2
MSPLLLLPMPPHLATVVSVAVTSTHSPLSSLLPLPLLRCSSRVPSDGDRLHAVFVGSLHRRSRVGPALALDDHVEIAQLCPLLARI